VNHTTQANYPIADFEEKTFYAYPVDPKGLRPNKNVIAVEVHQVHPFSSDISFDLELLPPAKLCKGPYLIYPGTNTSMKILWQLDDLSSCTLQWGVSPGDYCNGSVNTFEYGDYHQHQFTFSKLTPGIRYYYRLIVGIEEYHGSFYTAPPINQQHVKFMVYGDTRSTPTKHDNVASKMIETYALDPERLGCWMPCIC